MLELRFYIKEVYIIKKIKNRHQSLRFPSSNQLKVMIKLYFLWTYTYLFAKFY